MVRKDNGKKSAIKRRTVSAILLVLSAAAVFVLPYFFKSGFENDPFGDFYKLDREPSVGVITVWHIVSFKPYVGSLGTWIEKRAKEFLSAYNNLYFDIRSFSGDEAEAEYLRGVKPDIISFAYGKLDPGFLKKNEDQQPYAFPYCASGEVLLFDPFKADPNNFAELTERAGSAQDFKSGKVISCITDVRGAGDLYRAQIMGKCPYFEVTALGGKPELVQYIGIISTVADEKLPYVMAFIDYITGSEAQSSLTSIGLFPFSDAIEVKYEQDWLERLYHIVKDLGTPPLE